MEDTVYDVGESTTSEIYMEGQVIKGSFEADQTQGYISYLEAKPQEKDSKMVFIEEKNTRDLIFFSGKFKSELQDSDFLDHINNKVPVEYNVYLIFQILIRNQPTKLDFYLTDQISVDIQAKFNDTNVFLDYYLPLKDDEEPNGGEQVVITTIRGNDRYKWNGSLSETLPLLEEVLHK